MYVRCLPWDTVMLSGCLEVHRRPHSRPVSLMTGLCVISDQKYVPVMQQRVDCSTPMWDGYSTNRHTSEWSLLIVEI